VRLIVLLFSITLKEGFNAGVNNLSDRGSHWSFLLTCLT